MSMVLREHDDSTWVLKFAGAAGAAQAELLAADLMARANSMRCSGAEFGAVAMPEGFSVEASEPLPKATEDEELWEEDIEDGENQ